MPRETARRLPWRRPLLVVRLVGLLALTEMLRSAFFVGFFPLYAGRHLGLGASLVGLVTSVHYLTDALAKSGGGWLAERVRLGAVLAGSGLFGLLAVATLPHGPLAWMLLVAAAWGALVSPLWPAVLTFISRDSHRGYEARGVTLATALIAPLLGLAMLATGYLARQRPEEAYRYLLLGAALLALLALSLAGLKAPAAHQGREAYDWRRLIRLMPAAFVQTLSTGVLSPVLFLFIARVDLGVPRLAFLIAVGGGAALLVLALAGHRADRGEPRRLLVPGLFLAGLGLAGVGVLSLAYGPTWGVLLVSGLLIGVGYGLFFPGWNGLVVRSLPDADRAAAWGVIMTLEALGFAVGPALGGFTWDAFGPAGPFVTGGALMALVGGYYLWQLGRSDSAG